MNDRDLDSAGENAALNVGARGARVVLIEPRASFRECLARALMTFLPHVSIEGVKSSDEVAPGPAKRSRRGGGWNWVGVVSGLLNPNDSSVSALERRPRHDERYHEGGGCRRRGFAFR